MVRCSGYLGGDVREGLRAAAIALLAPQIQRTEARIRVAHPDDDDAMDAIALLASGLDVDRRRLRDLRARRAVQFTYQELPAAFRPDRWQSLYELRGDELVPVPIQRPGQPRPRAWSVAAK